MVLFLDQKNEISWLQLFGATYMVVAPEHSLVGALTTDGQRAQVGGRAQYTEPPFWFRRGQFWYNLCFPISACYCSGCLKPFHDARRCLVQRPVQYTTVLVRAQVEAYVTAAGAKSDLERTDLAKGKSGVPTGARSLAIIKSSPR